MSIHFQNWVQATGNLASLPREGGNLCGIFPVPNSDCQGTGVATFVVPIPDRDRIGHCSTKLTTKAATKVRNPSFWDMGQPAWTCQPILWQACPQGVPEAAAVLVVRQARSAAAAATHDALDGPGLPNAQLAWRSVRLSGREE
jgi:hypothetical protein